MIDAGHGHSDTGAKGFFSLVEKDVTLDIARRVRPLLERWGTRVILTRATDKHISLAKRSELAHQLKVDVLVSIHANSVSSTQNASGIEVYHLANSVRKNGTLFFADNPFDKRLAQLIDDYLDANIKQSRLLSQSIHESLLQKVCASGYQVKDRGVKQEGYFLLLHSQVPAQLDPPHFVPVSLVEVGFVSNKDEAKRLASNAYRQVLACGISDGIKNYLLMRG
jgi:N-acetylmuramoyl-L-alanine amidase